jgi:hypothetical protein
MSQLLQQETSAEQDRMLSEEQETPAEVAADTSGLSEDADTVLVGNIHKYLRDNKRFWAIFYTAMAGSLPFTFLMDHWLSPVSWWSQWPGDWLKTGFGMVWFFGVILLAARHRLLDSAVTSKGVVASMRETAETDPLALEGAVPAIRAFSRSWGLDKKHREAAHDTLERIEAARHAVGNLPVEAAAPLMPSDDLPVVVASTDAGSSTEPITTDPTKMP